MTILRTTLFLALAFSASVSAQKEYVLDKAHSSIAFEAAHVVVVPEVTDEAEDNFITVGTTAGSFQDFAIQFNPGDEGFKDAVLKVTIRTISLTTANEPRDAHLKSADFLDAETYPTIVFTSKNFEMVEPELLKVTGDLTMKGVTRPVAFDVKVLGSSTNRNGKDYLSFEAVTALDRLEFGLKWNDLLENGAFRISNYINIKVQANLIEDSAS